MNKSIAVLMGFVIAGAMSYQALAQVGGQSKGVQQASSTGAAPTTAPGVVPVRIAVLNINKVLKNFNKAQQLNTMISSKVNVYGQQINAKRDEAAKLQADAAKTIDPNQAEQIKKRLTQLEREVQDLDAEARKDVGSQQGTIAIGIYKDIEGVVQRVAVANGFDLVLSYPDSTTDTDMYSQANVVRKLASQAAIPLFYKPHIDLTEAVVQTLNATYPVAPPAVSATPNMAPPNPGAPKGKN